MLGLLFISDLRSAHLFSTWKKREAQRIFACFVQAHSPRSAANASQAKCRNTNPSHVGSVSQRKVRHLLSVNGNTVLCQCWNSEIAASMVLLRGGFLSVLNLARKCSIFLQILYFIPSTVQLLTFTYLRISFWQSLKIIIPISILAF